jgi:hypothetical protein
MANVLTPGLTPHQKQRLADALRRVAGLPLGSIALVYTDADVASARALDARELDRAQPCLAVAAWIAAEHRIPVDVAACVFGIATGVRLGRTFIADRPHRSKWISDEYKRLSEPNRRDVQRYIRRLLKIQEPTRHAPAASPQEEVAAARQWIKTAAQRRRAEEGR